MKLKNIAFTLIVFLILTFLMDGLSGLVTWLYVKPIQIWKGLPVSSIPSPHPYKAYYNEGKPDQRLWAKGEAPIKIAQMEFNYGLLDNGTMVNLFGHQLLPSDINLHETEKRGNEFRILFLGGSTTYLPWPFLTGEAIQERIKSRQVKVINAGTGGYTSQENLIDLMICGMSYKPDMVVAYLPINDIYQAAHYPNFRRDYTHVRIPLTLLINPGEAMPEPRFRHYPFTWKFINTILYNRKVRNYIKRASLSHYTTRQPPPYENNHFFNTTDYEKTVDAIIENIFNMKVLCEVRGIRFALITQKIIPNNPYYKCIGQDSNVLKAYKILDDLTMRCVPRIIASEQMKGADIIEMQRFFPDSWNEDAIGIVKQSFPHRQIDFNQPLTYDAMHFTPAGCFLFASIVADHIIDEIK